MQDNAAALPLTGQDNITDLPILGCCHFQFSRIQSYVIIYFYIMLINYIFPSFGVHVGSGNSGLGISFCKYKEPRF